MKLTALVLLAALCACRKAPPQAPTAEALGAELASFPQLLAPLTQASLADYNDAVQRKGAENVMMTSFRQSYEHVKGKAGNKEVLLFIGFSGTFQAPQGVGLQPMSIQQFLRAFAADAQVDFATVRTPKGNLFFTRAQLPEIIGAARRAGAKDDDLPFAIVNGSGR